ncbi:MAG: hypothetical protein AB9903_36175 [Vulcanimicrobiota bacterium]
MKPYSHCHFFLLLFFLTAFVFSLSSTSLEARRQKKTPTPSPSPSVTVTPESDETLTPSDLTSPAVSPTEEKSSSPQTSPTPAAPSSPQAAPTPEAPSSPQAAPTPEAPSSPQAAPTQEDTPAPETTSAPEEKLPIPPVEHSSILFTIDYKKVTRSFAEESVALSFSDIAVNGAVNPEKNTKLWDVVKESGYRIIEIRLNTGIAGLVKNKEADPSSAERYDFAPLDEIVKKAVSESYKLVFTCEIAEPPSDINIFTKEIDALLKHILQGWANGFCLTEKECAAVVFDFRPDTKQSAWNGKESEYSHIFALCSRNVKKFCKKIPVGGPGFYAPFTDEVCKKVSPHITAWLDDCSRGKVPLDLLYCRQGGMIPYGYFLKPRSIEQTVLTSYTALSPLFGRPHMMWSAETAPGSDTPLLHATVSVSALMCLIKGGADMIILPVPSVEKDSYTSALQYFNVFREMPVQLETVGLDRLCFILMACKSRDDKKACFIFSANNPSSYLLTAKDSAEKEEIERQYRSYVEIFTEMVYPPVYDRYRLNIENLPWKGEQLRYRRFVLESGGVVNCIEDKIIPGAKELYFNETIKSPSLQFIQLDVQPREDKEEKPKEGKEEKPKN